MHQDLAIRTYYTEHIVYLVKSIGLLHCINAVF